MTRRKVDFTQWRPGLHVGYGKIDVCPQCGRVGRVTRFPNGAVQIVHQAENIDGVLRIIASCFVKARQ